MNILNNSDKFINCVQKLVSQASNYNVEEIKKATKEIENVFIEKIIHAVSKKNTIKLEPETLLSPFITSTAELLEKNIAFQALKKDINFKYNLGSEIFQIQKEFITQLEKKIDKNRTEQLKKALTEGEEYSNNTYYIPSKL